MSPDYKTLCAELVDDYWPCHYRSELLDRARAELDKPEPMPPTDEDLLAMRSWSCHGPTFDSDLVDFGRRCYNLGRYGTPTNAAELDAQ
jgi:hypothetical protein